MALRIERVLMVAEMDFLDEQNVLVDRKNSQPIAIHSNKFGETVQQILDDATKELRNGNS